jgi:hypothetical protein
MIKRALFVVLVVMLAGAAPAFGRGGGWNTVTYNGFSFSFDPALAANVNIVAAPGDPADMDMPGGPEVRHTEFILYNGVPAPEAQWDAVGGIRLYYVPDFAGYDFPTQELTQLQTLLADRPDLASYMVVTDNMSENTLPFMPVFPAAQVIRARAQYVDLPTLSGISYITAYRQDAFPFTSHEFWYTFQGLSADGQYYVSAAFKLSTTIFPAEIAADFDYEAFIATIADYMNQSVTQLNAATPDQFTPSLTVLDGIIQSFGFAAM